MLDPIAGPLLKGLGSLLALLYDFLRSYGVAIIFLTVLVRVVLLPLTIRQTRSMQEMQKLQPKVKELQRKYKGNRQKLAEETQKLYREHQVNPLGGCLPLLLQLPVFFALFGVLRATEGAFAIPADPPAAVAEGVICRPDTSPTVDGVRATAVVCEARGGEVTTYEIEEWLTKNGTTPIEAPPPSLAICPRTEERGGDTGFRCESVLGPGHLPEDSDLFAAIVDDRAEFLGIELGCSPLQAASPEAIRLCAGPGTGGGVVTAIPYFVLVALMVGSTWYQQRQMQQAAAGQAAQQAQLMARIMPIFLGVISVSISAGVLVYWVTTNAWQIGQQYLMLRSRVAESAPRPPTGGSKQQAKSAGGKGGKGVSSSPKAAQGDGSKTKGSGHAGSRKKRRKR